MWNKREKEVAEALYDKEQAVLKALEKYYEQALEDVDLSIRILQADEQTQSKIHRIHYQETLKKQIEGALEKLHTDTYKSIAEYLNDSYTDSFVGVMYDLHGQGVPVIAPIDQNAAIKAIQLDTKLSERKIHPSENGELVTLYESLGVDVDGLKKTIRSEITRGISTGMKYDDIARNVSMVTKAPLARAKTIVRTEGHRIQQASQEDARQVAKAHGADVVKQWDSTLDGATRSTHRHLDGQIREVNKPFTSGTKEAMFPGDFGDPAEDCNCRCTALTRARAALDEEELATMKERAKFFGLEEDKKQSFAEFEKTYLKAAKEEAKAPARKFVPAKSKAEAETFANQFANKVDYRGVTLDNANEINDQLDYLTSKYPIDKLGEISVGSRGIMHANFESLGISKTRLGKAIEDSHKNFLNMKQDIKDELRIIEERFAGKKRLPPDLQKKVDKHKSNLRYDRWAIFESYDNPLKVVVTHEYGHIISDQYFGMINNSTAKANYTKNPAIRAANDQWKTIYERAYETGDVFGISMYGGTDSKEFFAECFAAREMGEKLPDYIEKFMDGVLKNGIL